MKSYLIVFICVLVLMLNFSSTLESKSTIKFHERKLSKMQKRPDPSKEPLPEFWTTGSTPKIAIQMNKKYENYNKRLSSLYKYKDHSKDLLTNKNHKNKQKKSNKKTSKKKHNKKNNKKHKKKHNKKNNKKK